MMIGAIDLQYNRKQNLKRFRDGKLNAIPSTSKTIILDENLNTSEENEMENVQVHITEQKDLSYTNSSCHNATSSNNLLKLNALPVVLDRYKVSNRVGAAIASAALVDAGLINDKDSCNIIDKNKLV